MRTTARRVVLGSIWLFVTAAIWVSVFVDPDFDPSELPVIALLIVIGTVGTLIVDGHPRNPIGWLYLAVFGFISLNMASATSLTYLPLSPEIRILVFVFIDEVLNVAVWFSMLIVPAFYFPSGRLPSKKWRLFPWIITAALLLLAISGLLNPNLASERHPDFVNPLAVAGADSVFDSTGLVLILASILALLSLVVRFRSSTGIERQQFKWPLFSAVAGLIALVLFLITSLVFGVEPDALQDSILAQVVPLLEAGYVISFPVTIGIGILRYRLYDIDIIIRRTIQYSLLTAILTLVYFGTVIQLQSLFRAATGQDSPLAVVISTLAIAALFNPLRSRIQKFVDRRFYRRQYDAQQTLARFAGAAGDQVDLDGLTELLIQAVGETMQPKIVSLWLADHQQPRKGLSA